MWQRHSKQPKVTVVVGSSCNQSTVHAHAYLLCPFVVVNQTATRMRRPLRSAQVALGMAATRPRFEHLQTTCAHVALQWTVPRLLCEWPQ